MSKSHKNSKNKSILNQNIKLQHNAPLEQKVVKRQYKEEELVFFDDDDRNQKKKNNQQSEIVKSEHNQQVESKLNKPSTKKHNHHHKSDKDKDTDNKQHKDSKDKDNKDKDNNNNNNNKTKRSKHSQKSGKSVYLRQQQEQYKGSNVYGHNNAVKEEEGQQEQCKIDYFFNDDKVKSQQNNQDYYNDYYDIFQRENETEVNQKQKQKYKQKQKQRHIQLKQHQQQEKTKKQSQVKNQNTQHQKQQQQQHQKQNNRYNLSHDLLDEDDQMVQRIIRQSELYHQEKEKAAQQQLLQLSNQQEKQEDNHNQRVHHQIKHKKISRISNKSKNKKQRKIRTTITLDKLNSMNSIFLEYYEKRHKGQPPEHNLKEIGSLLQLGYSTILHKYREFRQQKKVKGGALIQSLQRKRKYKKSKDIQNYINKALQIRGFYTAVQLSRYIYQTWGKNYSRSIISRHLGEMGFSYKNLKKKTVQPYIIQHPKVNMFKKIYAATILQRVKSKQRIMYLHQLHFLYDNNSKQIKIINANRVDSNIYENKHLITVTLICERTGLSYYRIHPGAYNKVEFMEQMKDFSKIAIPQSTNDPSIKKQQDQPNGDIFWLDITQFYQNNHNETEKQLPTQIYLIMARNQAHGDCPSHQFNLIKYLSSKGIQLIYLPPYIRKQGINVMENWSKVIVGKFHQKTYHLESWEEILDLGSTSAQKTFLQQLQTFLQQKKGEGLQKLYDDVESLLVRMEAIRIQ